MRLGEALYFARMSGLNERLTRSNELTTFMHTFKKLGGLPQAVRTDIQEILKGGANWIADGILTVKTYQPAQSPGFCDRALGFL